MPDDTSLEVLVTGASGALGGAVCRVFLEHGARVAAVARRRSDPLAGALAHRAPRLVLLEAELGEAASAQQAVDEAARRLGRLRALCCVAGAFEMGPFAEAPPEQMERMLTANFRSAYHAARAAVPHLVAAGGGKIVLVGARSAVEPAPGKVAYGAAKAAVVSMGRSLAAELLPHGIQVNTVLPSTIDTPANRAAMPDADASAWPTPEAIARVVHWLCSAEADPVSGAEIPVYGRG